MSKLLSFVIPCYRSERTIKTVVEEIVRTVKTRAEYDYEIVLVSDHSPDGVFEVIRGLAKEDARIHGLEFAKNFGQHAALMAGYRETRGDYVISMDDDGQTPADELYLLVDKLEEGFDIVFGTYETIRQNPFRVFGSRVNKIMMELLIDKPKKMETTSYFACRRFIIDEVVRYQNSYPYIGGLLFRSTQNIGTVRVKHRDRLEGASGYGLKKLLSLWMNGFTAFSVKPLRIATTLGGLLAGAGFIWGGVTIIRKLLNPDIPAGWSSTVALLLFIGGMLMLMLGLIGEYIGRIYISINNAPQYVVRDTINLNEQRTQEGDAHGGNET